jgi:hypothetical protein
VHRYDIDERRAASLLLAKHGVPLLHKTKIKQHTYTINRMKITSMQNQTRIVVVSPGVNDDDDGAAQKQQPTGERRRRVVHCATQQQAGSARRRRGCCIVRRAPCTHRKGAREEALRRAAVFGSEGWAHGLGRRGCRNSGISPRSCAAREKEKLAARGLLGHGDVVGASSG